MPGRFRIPAPDSLAQRRVPWRLTVSVPEESRSLDREGYARRRKPHTQIRFEILNLTNTPKFNGSSAGNSIDLSSFGRITSQRGFMRIWQLSFRYLF